MGYFYLYRNDSPSPPTSWWRAQARAGFRERVTLAANDWTLFLGGKLDGSGPHFVRSGANFAACTGIFFYRGKRLERGLQLLLDEFDGVGFPWIDCRGHYAVVVFKAGRLWLASDELGAYKIYRTLDWSRFSSSFSAVQASLQSAEPDSQGIYEYAFNGATFGEKTLLRHVKQQREGVLYSIPEAGPPRPSTPRTRDTRVAYSSIEEAADDYAERLRALFSIYSSDGRRVRSALSGGYDSRLILALLLNAGIRPELFVYGDDHDPDVVVAKAIAHGEGFSLEQVDKDELQRSRRGSPELAWARFDGWNNAGLFDNGVDDEDRVRRARAGVDILNGSGGECFRNFFYLRNGTYSPEQIVWTFYSQYDPSHVTHRFRQASYVEELAEDMRQALVDHPRQAKLTRVQVEALYPWFRVRYWTGRDVGLNQRFGPLLFPFLEPCIFSGTECIPVALKDHGRLEGLILKRIAPQLAKYPSSYGYPLSRDAPLGYRLKMALTLWRPTYVRQFGYRVRRRFVSPAPQPEWFHEALESANVDPSLPAMREFFRVENISDFDVLNRVATVELVLSGGPWATQPRLTAPDRTFEADTDHRAA